ncbi:oligosaccharide flippase family protein [Snuella sedimenti]|uniref:Oligosaccharide flippase family protein n=1 Tax=Snuella sedimenti TaxID=2798802 RepID=A0A8J7J5A1_9FLAO|nr:oligosaccharide flippase family protein [Snuella sedimenti]MBJ6368819.1 oligosaccharide flippase family protein [Snuella sedimenti]
MGIVVSQSIKNTLTTYLGFGVGAINVLFLFTNFISDVYFGLITFIFSTANVMMPLMAFGVHNTIIKFYSSFKTRQSQNSFLTMMLILPLVVILPFGLIGYVAFDTISNWLTKENPIIEDYILLIYISAIAFAYFEIFYAWSRVQMQSVLGNFMKELFHRIATTILLFCLYFEMLNVDQLIYSIVGVYIIRLVVMALYAFSIRRPVFKFTKLLGIRNILNYSALIIIAGSVANVILEIDKFMLGHYIQIENVAYYGVAIYIASVIGVPSRAMHQITSPLTAKLLNEKDMIELKNLYQKSSLNLFIVSGLIFLLIVLNINELYHLIPEKFSGGLLIVILIGVAKLTDNLLGNNNAILFNSDYYRMVLLLGALLVIVTVVLNTLFIPAFGINGAAYATFISVMFYNLSKVLFVKHSFKMQPFTKATLSMLLLIVLCFFIFYFWDFPFHPVINIGLKSLMVSFIYGYVVYYFKISKIVNSLLDRFLRRN